MSRYAIYCLPDDAFGRQGAEWLGWDAAHGHTVEKVAAPADWTETPRKYGFHATLKPPFRLTEGRTRADLRAAVAELAAQTAPACAERLVPAAMGRFAAFRPQGESDLARVAEACVVALDPFRGPAAEEELARRRASGLTDRQEALLTRWGYPYVLDEFRFHITLTGKISEVEAALARARQHFTPPAPFRLDALALCEETQDGFRLLHRYPLTGERTDRAEDTA